MARVKIAMPDAEAVLSLADETGCLVIRAFPNSASDAIVLPIEPGRTVLTIRTTATPEEGKANSAILRLLAKALGQPISSLEIVRGVSTRTKLVRISPKHG